MFQPHAGVGAGVQIEGGVADVGHCLGAGATPVSLPSRRRDEIAAPAVRPPTSSPHTTTSTTLLPAERVEQVRRQGAVEAGVERDAHATSHAILSAITSVAPANGADRRPACTASRSRCLEPAVGAGDALARHRASRAAARLERQALGGAAHRVNLARRSSVTPSAATTSAKAPRHRRRRRLHRWCPTEIAARPARGPTHRRSSTQVAQWPARRRTSAAGAG